MSTKAYNLAYFLQILSLSFSKQSWELRYTNQHKGHVTRIKLDQDSESDSFLSWLLETYIPDSYTSRKLKKEKTERVFVSDLGLVDNRPQDEGVVNEKLSSL